MIDYLIVGSGLFGSVFAHEAKKRGYTVKIIEKRHHVGGNVYCENIEGINVHKYGAHIFHTNDKAIWDYVSQFVEFNRFTNSPLALSKGRYYNLPFNMNTFYQLWKVATPAEAKAKIESQRGQVDSGNISNLEEQAISLVGTDIYQALIKEYTEKQWGRDCRDLPAFIIKRLPVRFTYDNNYFNDKYQGIPTGGYNKLIESLLEGIDVELNVDFFTAKTEYENQARKVVYTGPIDKYFRYQFGRLDYRTLRFETEVIDSDNYQGNAVVNYIDKQYPFTRIIEHKHFEFGDQEKTVITREYPKEFAEGDEYYYPVNDSKNNRIYASYKQLAAEEKKVIFGGRPAEYKYYDMHQIIASALKCVEKEFEWKQIIAVVVTYKRKELLQNVLHSLLNQSYSLSRIVIVDNNSNDGTQELCAELALKHPMIEYNNTGANLGGAGGFSYGFTKALEYDFDYLWLMDDDLQPASDCLEQLLNAQSTSSFGIVQPLRINKDGSCAELSPMEFDLDTFLRIKPKTQTVADYLATSAEMADRFTIAGVPFEGPLIDRAVIDKIGIPDARFFIFYDDMDFSIRARKAGFTIGCITSARATRLLINNQQNDLASWKGYFMLRNLFYLFFTHGTSLSSRLKPFILASGFMLVSLSRFRFKETSVCFDALKDSLRFITNRKYIP